MSFLTKSLEKRIQELRASIEAQTTELAAYEQVLALESGKPAESVVSGPAAVAASPAPAPAVDSGATLEFNGSRSDFVGLMLKQHSATGITPPEIAAAFAARKIKISKNLVYNVLSLMFKQKKVRKSGGRYFYVSKADTPVATKKRRISEEGMKRIIAATKKRWTLQRAAKAKGR